MGGAIDDHATHSADAFTTIGIERHGLLALMGQLLVELIKHLEERGVAADSIDLIGLDGAVVGTLGLTPDIQCQLHL